MKEKISVVLASYNGEKYIEEQLLSIAGQTRTVDEVLIVDDHSCDKTTDIVRDIINDRHPDYWKMSVNKENVGYARNFINGINAATGDIIFLSDQDDIWHSDKIEKMMQCFQKNPKACLLLSDCRYFYEDTKQKQVNRTTDLHFDKESGKVYKRNNWSCIKGLGCTFALRKSLLPIVNALWFPGYPHDLCIWHAAALCDGIYFCNEKLLDYRRHGNNVSGQFERSVRFRTDCIHQHILYLKRMQEYVMSAEEVLSITSEELEKQIKFWEDRKKYLEERNYLLWLKMSDRLSYYDRKRNWVSDLFCMVKQ